MRKSNLFSLILLAIVFSSCKKRESVRHTVQYYIACKGNMNVTYTNAGGELLTENNVASGLVYAFNTPGDRRKVYLVVKSIDESPVDASIFIDGHEAASGTSDTGYISLTTQLP